jgi:hypothetical protein
MSHRLRYVKKTQLNLGGLELTLVNAFRPSNSFSEDPPPKVSDLSHGCLI